MSKQRKKSRAVLVVSVLAILCAALCVGCFYAGDAIRAYHDTKLASEVERVEAQNALRQQEYAAALAEFQQENSTTANLAWPVPEKGEGWEIVDLTNYPLEMPYTQTLSRAETMNNGMLLVNQWHSRPDDFDETEITGVGSYTGWKIQVNNASVTLFPVAIEALKEAIAAAEAEGMTHYLVSEGYRSWDSQNTMFQSRVQKLSSKYSGDELIEAAKKEVNYPGTSEFNSGMAFTLRLYDKTDASVGSAKYSSTPAGQWMTENGWKYGLIFRFPLADWPIEGMADKSYKTGISSSLNLYRYVGKPHAAAMHAMDFCLEEYIEYLQDHPHIALFEDGQLKYEIVRQYVGNADYFEVQMAGKASGSTVSMDNMGAVISAFSY